VILAFSLSMLFLFDLVIQSSNAILGALVSEVLSYGRGSDPRQAGRWRKDPEGGAVFFPPRPLPPSVVM